MKNKIKQSIKIIQDLQTDEIYHLAFSGGKDSIVLLDLAKKSGVKFNAHYNNTTIDPPGHIKFIKDNYPEVNIIQPPKTFYQLVEKKGLPTRKMRYCCQYLKEYSGIGKRIIDGIRKQESHKRSKYEHEQCDTRKWMKGAVHVRPLLNWPEKQIWNYIKSNNLPYPKYYDPPYLFKRIGCIGCPFANKQRIKEYKLFPKYLKAIIKTLNKNMNNHPDSKFNDEYEMIYWWLSEMNINNFIELRDNGLFKINYKEHIIELFNLNNC